jgi:hypothetical protein
MERAADDQRDRRLRSRRWQQIGGDVSWETHGVVLGKDEPLARQVHLVRIDPWMEHDKEAAVTHGLYVVDETTIDYEDLGTDRPDVAGAIKSVELPVAEYKRLEPVYKAEILASHSGYSDSRSTNKLADALPAPPEEIDFWHGKETLKSLAASDLEMRRAALDANFDTRFTFGEMPPDEALDFALGDEPFEMSLEGQDGLAFEYATALAGVSGSTTSREDFAATVQALAAAPPPVEIDPNNLEGRLEEVLVEWEQRYGDPTDEEEGIAVAAQSLASSMMSAVGFEWI